MSRCDGVFVVGRGAGIVNIGRLVQPYESKLGRRLLHGEGGDRALGETGLGPRRAGVWCCVFCVSKLLFVVPPVVRADPDINTVASRTRLMNRLGASTRRPRHETVIHHATSALFLEHQRLDWRAEVLHFWLGHSSKYTEIQSYIPAGNLTSKTNKHDTGSVRYFLPDTEGFAAREPGRDLRASHTGG